MSVKAIGRGAGRSATGAAAYRSAECIVDQRTGEVHDYTRKAGVLATALVLPGGATPNRAEFWNGVETHHKRGDAVLAREFTLALPHELAPAERERLAFDYGRELADRYGVAVDVALHEPDKGGDNRNYHAHVMMSACSVEPDGKLGRKAVELDPIHCQKHRIENFAERERPRWAELHNERMAENGLSERIDHRSLEAQGIDREPTQHLGPAAIGYERRTGQRSDLRIALEAEAAERLQRARELGEQERARQAAPHAAVVLASADVASALRERDKLHGVRAALTDARTGWAELRMDVGRDRARDRAKLEQERKAEQERQIEEARRRREQERQAAPPGVRAMADMLAQRQNLAPDSQAAMEQLRRLVEEDKRRQAQRQRDQARGPDEPSPTPRRSRGYGGPSLG